ncbi:MAG: polysaccharide export protein EpsE [Nitrosospira sp.]|jgi:polysaccharide export outer membrane protein|nr:polysaccharide export protein EpsE [Nitrosospira sp.]
MIPSIIKKFPLFLALFIVFFTTGVSGQDNLEYPLGPGDILRIQVFQNPDLTTETRVSETGSITYPLIGAVEVGGLSIAEAERKISDALKKGGYIKQAQVNIVLLQMRGSQVSVLGQVNRPGRFPLETLSRVSDMLASAGGATMGGDDYAIVTGLRDGKHFRKVIDIPALYLGEKPDEDIYLAGGDVVYVHRAPVFYIYGEAQRPGAYRIERGMTVMQALAQGGGPTPRGSEWRLRLHRKQDDGKVVKLSPEMTDLVQPNDIIYVRESIF